MYVLLSFQLQVASYSALLVGSPKVHLRLERWDIRDHMSSLAEWKNHPSAISFDVMLQDDNVRSYEKINNYSCVSQYLININERIGETCERKRIMFSLESVFLNATAELYTTDDDYITK